MRVRVSPRRFAEATASPWSMTMRALSRWIAALPLAVGLSVVPALVAQNPAAIEHSLRYAVRLAGQPDTALDLLDRMHDYHVPAVSIAIIDNDKVVFAKAYGVKRFGSTEP